MMTGYNPVMSHLSLIVTNYDLDDQASHQNNKSNQNDDFPRLSEWKNLQDRIKVDPESHIDNLKGERVKSAAEGIKKKKPNLI